MKTFYCKSFNLRESGGNPAGVVILENDDMLSDADMLRIAGEIGFSETAFVKERSSGNYDVRFFTPVTEVDLCGHATIAAFYCIAELCRRSGRQIHDTVWQNTKAGKLAIRVFYDGDAIRSVLMEQAKPVAYDVIRGDMRNKVAQSLAIRAEELCLPGSDVEPRIVSTGLKDVIIPVADREKLNEIVINKQAVTDISKELDVIGYHVYTLDQKQLYARNFAPHVGIDEECATGTSNGALGYLLHSHGVVGSYMEILQGEAMGETSKICVNVVDEGGECRVLVGGTAIITQEFES